MNTFIHIPWFSSKSGPVTARQVDKETTQVNTGPGSFFASLLFSLSLLPLRSASPAAMALGSVSPSKRISHHALHCISIMPPPTCFLNVCLAWNDAVCLAEVIHNVLSSGLGFLCSHWEFLRAADPCHLRVFPIKVRLPDWFFGVLEQLPAKWTDFFRFL